MSLRQPAPGPQAQAQPQWADERLAALAQGEGSVNRSLGTLIASLLSEQIMVQRQIVDTLAELCRHLGLTGVPAQTTSPRRPLAYDPDTWPRQP